MSYETIHTLECTERRCPMGSDNSGLLHQRMQQPKLGIEGGDIDA